MSSFRFSRELAAVAAFFLASSIPFVHEVLQPGHAAICGINHGIASLISRAEADQAVCAKIVLVLVALLFWLSSNLGGFQAPRLARFAAHSPQRTALWIAALTAIGLAAFDCCTAFHGASTDSSGMCHCWLTGVLAMVSAGVAGLSVHGARVFTRWVWHVLRMTIVAGLWVSRSANIPFVRHNTTRIPNRLTLAHVARSIGERAPPIIMVMLQLKVSSSR